MFRKNDQHQQIPLSSSIYALPEKQLERLEASWADTFYHEHFARIEEGPFAVLYSDEPSRPNIPINVMIGLDTLKSGFGWSDAEIADNKHPMIIFVMTCRYDTHWAIGIWARDISNCEQCTTFGHESQITCKRQERT